MQFLVLGYDGDDAAAMDRRLAVREAHLKSFKERVERGEFLFGSAILDDAGKMIGSLTVCEFESREAMQTQWLDSEPYILGDVWRRVEIHRGMVPAFVMDKLNRKTS